MGSHALRLLSFIFVNTNQPQSEVLQFSLNSAFFISILFGEINGLPLNYSVETNIYSLGTTWVPIVLPKLLLVQKLIFPQHFNNGWHILSERPHTKQHIYFCEHKLHQQMTCRNQTLHCSSVSRYFMKQPVQLPHNTAWLTTYKLDVTGIIYYFFPPLLLFSMGKH